MFDVIKNVLAQGDYNLKDILHKIDVLWAKGKLTDAEYEELVALAREGAKAENSLDIFEKFAELDKRVSALEKGETGEDTPAVGYPEYEVGKWYYKDAVCSYEGKNYVCIVPEGVVCVWSPAEYPAYWKTV